MTQIRDWVSQNPKDASQKPIIKNTSVIDGLFVGEIDTDALNEMYKEDGNSVKDFIQSLRNNDEGLFLEHVAKQELLLKN